MEEREYAGVEFLIAPWMIKSIKSFHQFSNRLAALTLYVEGGSTTLITAYAPHNGLEAEYRREFFDQLSNFVSSQRPHGPTFILGDLNSRLHYRQEDEKSILGPFVFENLNF